MFEVLQCRDYVGPLPAAIDLRVATLGLKISEGQPLSLLFQRSNTDCLMYPAVPGYIYLLIDIGAGNALPCVSRHLSCIKHLLLCMKIRP